MSASQLSRFVGRRCCASGCVVKTWIQFGDRIGILQPVMVTVGNDEKALCLDFLSVDIFNLFPGRSRLRGDPTLIPGDLVTFYGIVEMCISQGEIIGYSVRVTSGSFLRREKQGDIDLLYNYQKRSWIATHKGRTET